MAVSAALVPILAAGAIVALVAVLVWRRVTFYMGPAAAEPDSFSIERYEPMLRLLSAEDMDFLRRTAGSDPKISTEWEKQRRRILRLYLNELCGDFRRLHARARMLAAEAPSTDSEMVSGLIRQQVRFWRAIAGIELRLLLSSSGLTKVDARILIAALNDMNTRVASLSAPASA
jgi:hypothetical protein